MKKLFLLLLLNSFGIKAQTYHINDFSKEYSAVIITDEKDKEKQTLKIIENKTQKTIIKEIVNLSEYDFEDTKSNIREIPYGHQSIIIYDDFNFDGKKDLAIKYGNESCYSGPSYVVYLLQGNTFVKNAAFSDLAQNYCGFFSIDTKNKQLHTMTKSGCCWHQYSDFEIKNNKPFLINQVEEQMNPSGLYFEIGIKTWKNGKYINTGKDIISNEEDLKNMMVMSYVLENGKKMYLLYNGTPHLYYFLTKNDGEIEFQFDGTFYYSKKDNTLSFSNPSASYSIFNDRIEVTFKNKKTIFKANLETRKNNISEVYNLSKTEIPENLEIND